MNRACANLNYNFSYLGSTQLYDITITQAEPTKSTIYEYIAAHTPTKVFFDIDKYTIYHPNMYTSRGAITPASKIILTLKTALFNFDAAKEKEMIVYDNTRYDHDRKLYKLSLHVILPDFVMSCIEQVGTLVHNIKLIMTKDHADMIDMSVYFPWKPFSVPFTYSRNGEIKRSRIFAICKIDNNNTELHDPEYRSNGISRKDLFKRSLLQQNVPSDAIIHEYPHDEMMRAMSDVFNDMTDPRRFCYRDELRRDDHVIKNIGVQYGR